MKIIKIILLVLVSLVLILLVTGIFVKKDYGVLKSVTINKPKQEVFNYLKLLKNQDNFSKWASMDVNMKKSYKGDDGTVGFVSRWESTNDEVGTGEQEIKKIIEGERLDFELRFIEPFASTSSAFMTTTALGENQTKVEWGFKGNMSYPTNLMLVFMDLEKMVGDDFQQGLNNLKVILEK